MASIVLAAGTSAPALAQAPGNDPLATIGLSSGTLVKLDLNLVVGNPVHIVLPIDGQQMTLDMIPFACRGETYRVWEDTGNGPVEVKAGEVTTLRGVILEDEGSVTAGGIMADGLYARIILADGRDFWLQPVPAAGEGMYAVYTVGNVAPIDGICPVGDAEAIHDAGTGHPHGERGITRYDAQVACDADWEFYSYYGSTAQVEARMNLVLNTMNLQYERDVNIRHVISDIFLHAFEDDPYTTNDSADLLAQFRDHWEDVHGGIVRDTAHLFTGREVDGNVIGRAYIGVICSGSSAYGFVQSDFNNNFMSATDLSAHELGHNWDADHCTCSSPPYTMNPSITSINRFQPGNDIDEIIAHRNSRGCLTESAFGGLLYPNNLCDDATIVGEGRFAFSNVAATTDGPAACGSIEEDVWFRYIAPCNGTITIETCTSETTFDTVVVAYTGSCDSLNEIECDDDTSGCGNGFQSRISFDVTRNTSYRIRVGGFNGAEGSGILDIDQTSCPHPSNDDCANATEVEQGSTGFSTVGATLDGPIENTDCLNAGDAQIGSDVWFRYVADCTGVVRVSTCGSLFDTKVGVYFECSTTPNASFECNDDNGPACAGLDASVEFNGLVGADYYIRVGGYNDAVGTGILTITQASCPTPANDDCSDAINVVEGSYSGTLVASTNDGTASCGASGTNGDVWYRFTTPGCGGTLVVTTCGTHDDGGEDTGVDTVIAMFNTCGGAQLACNDDTAICLNDGGANRDSLLSRSVDSGEVILIRVSSFSTDAPDDFFLNVSYEPENDDCGNFEVATLGSTPFCNVGAETDGPAGCNASEDVWFRYTAGANGQATVSLCGSLYDTYLAVYGSTACPPVNQLACNDDNGPACAGLDSSITFDAVAGTTYTIRIGGFLGANGNGTLTISLIGGNDCNGNGVPDPAEIAGNPSLDCFNAAALPVGGFHRRGGPNGVLDMCECVADWNRNGIVGSSDITAFLASWFNDLATGQTKADVNCNGVVGSSDITFFLNYWFGGLSGNPPYNGC
ncbi:MAG: hypothetical protein H7Y88_13590 [Phycisphaerales bacterium]|nr:hypothetical protein [Phycisphaerales bacterium]